MDSGTVPSATPTVASGAGGYDMGARRFGPDLGSFLQQDQFSGALADLGLALDPLTQNRYALAGGNPISYVEWDGHVATTLQQLENINAEPAVTDPDPKTQQLININSGPDGASAGSGAGGGKGAAGIQLIKSIRPISPKRLQPAALGRSARRSLGPGRLQRRARTNCRPCTSRARSKRSRPRSRRCRLATGSLSACK